MLIGEKLKYLLGLLNSSLFRLAFKKFYQSGGIEGKITVQSMEQIPIVYSTSKQELKIKNLVAKILAKKRKKRRHHRPRKANRPVSLSALRLNGRRNKNY